MSGIDLNRAACAAGNRFGAGYALGGGAVAYAKTLHGLVRWIDICDGNMQEGSFRCDANVSVRRPGAAARHARRDQEPQLVPVPRARDRVSRRSARSGFSKTAEKSYRRRALRSGQDETRSMRIKEEAHDYRYFPTGLTSLEVSEKWIEQIRAELPELPKRSASVTRPSTRYRLTMLASSPIPAKRPDSSSFVYRCSKALLPRRSRTG